MISMRNQDRDQGIITKLGFHLWKPKKKKKKSTLKIEKYNNNNQN